MAAKKTSKKTSTKRPSERASKPPVAGERREHAMIDARAERDAVKRQSGKSSGMVRK